MEGVDICWVEEAERITDESWRVLIPTIRAPGSEIWITFNTGEESDPVFKRFIAQTHPAAMVLKVGWEDNPYFPKELEQEREYDYSVDPEAAENTWGGAPRTRNEAQILAGKWVVEEAHPGPDWNGPYYGADFGLRDPTVLVECWVSPQLDELGRRDLLIRREAYKVGLPINEITNNWREACPHFHRHVVRADASRPDTILYLADHGVPRIEAAPKGAGSVEDGIAHLRGYRRIIVHPTCEHTANECRRYSYAVDHLTGDVLTRIVDQHNHCIDSIRYALAPMIRPQNTPPAAFSPAAERAQAARRKVVGRGRR